MRARTSSPASLPAATASPASRSCGQRRVARGCGAGAARGKAGGAEGDAQSETGRLGHGAPGRAAALQTVTFATCRVSSCHQQVASATRTRTPSLLIPSLSDFYLRALARKPESWVSGR